MISKDVASSLTVQECFDTLKVSEPSLGGYQTRNVAFDIVQVLNWREYAAQELGLTGTRGDRLYDMISSNFRFGSGYAARKYLREQRDKFKPDSNEYKKWDKKIKEL